MCIHKQISEYLFVYVCIVYLSERAILLNLLIYSNIIFALGSVYLSLTEKNACKSYKRRVKMCIVYLSERAILLNLLIYSNIIFALGSVYLSLTEKNACKSYKRRV